MRTTRTIFAMVAICVIVLTLFQGCAFFPKTTPELTDPNPSDDIHTIHKTMSMVSEELEADRRDNPTRYKYAIQERREITFIGEITDIEGAHLQFHIKKRWYYFDEYGDCDFGDEKKLNDQSINIGVIVTVKGVVTDLPIRERILKLASCSILEYH